ncbi:DUF4129 domain-containing protein [Gracilibacillus caseinilyticus]|uniref:DUF4129 domain-containing protein n=1 Tax=Gracilibacillus caseinilyticus TaxID=2932256 RepID=A0ABY4EXR6_9BACI|nr:DUF4129 domain-containing protein [Gracilibacillus caseinilyticus]UOQ49209.1 DUF4129 domain-containing protein [Gracilibacillus caseinilyticus]
MSDYQKEREQLKKILQQDEYQVYQQDNRSIIEKIYDHISSWISDLLDNMFQSFEPGSTAGNIIVVVLVISLAVILVLGILTFTTFMVRRKKWSSYQPFLKNTELSWDYQQHMRMVATYEAEANYQLAIRHQFLALLLRLEEYHLLTIQQWKTNREYYEELNKRDRHIASSFYRLAVQFEHVTYGEKTVQQTDYLKYQEQIDGLSTHIGQQQVHEKLGDH